MVEGRGLSITSIFRRAAVWIAGVQRDGRLGRPRDMGTHQVPPQPGKKHVSQALTEADNIKVVREVVETVCAKHVRRGWLTLRSLRVTVTG
jgi:hypothetical protein